MVQGIPPTLNIKVMRLTKQHKVPILKSLNVTQCGADSNTTPLPDSKLADTLPMPRVKTTTQQFERNFYEETLETIEHHKFANKFCTKKT